jgi:hypothetical protein
MTTTTATGIAQFERFFRQPILEHIATLPRLDLGYSDGTEAQLPLLVGGLSVALARAFKIIDPKLKNPQTEQWERAFSIFNRLL